MAEKEKIKEIQRLLNKLGYETKRIDGKLDKTTAMMIGNFVFDYKIVESDYDYLIERLKEELNEV